MMTDSISAFLTRIRNATHARHPKVDVDASRMRLAITDILKQGGFIKDFRLYRNDKKGVLRIYLKYLNRNQPAIQGLSRISKPSRRVFRTHDALPTVQGGIGVAVISTSKGILSDKAARENRVGGEVLCQVW